jgi:hypothetical protein
VIGNVVNLHGILGSLYNPNQLAVQWRSWAKYWINRPDVQSQLIYSESQMIEFLMP